MIIPGERIGQLEFGMTAEMLHHKLGKADSGDAAMGKALLFWVSRQANRPQHYVAVYTVNNFNGQGTPPTVQQVQVTSPQFQTAGGIGSGTPISEIRKQFLHLEPLAYYSNQENQQVYIYDDPAQGIAFEVTTADSLCTAITVHQKGEDITDTYLPIYPDRTLLK